MIIMGRDMDWTQDQRTDFEVIRRKYRHVLEIMTYDDLLRRLKTIREQFNLGTTHKECLSSPPCEKSVSNPRSNTPRIS